MGSSIVQQEYSRLALGEPSAPPPAPVTCTPIDYTMQGMIADTGEILAIRDTPPGSGWGTVPTPVF